jgi:hypothetical protein
MAFDKITVLLFLGGFIGWTLFALTIVHSICVHRKQLIMVDDISKELKKVKEELRELK